MRRGTLAFVVAVDEFLKQAVAGAHVGDPIPLVVDGFVFIGALGHVDILLDPLVCISLGVQDERDQLGSAEVGLHIGQKFIEQAAQLDGYAWYEVFFRVLLPLIKPGLVAASLLAFIFAWNSFTFPLILSGVRVQTITITSLRFLASDTVHYGQVAVASLIAVLPEIVVCLFIQKHLVRGLSFGAVKG